MNPYNITVSPDATIMRNVSLSMGLNLDKNTLEVNRGI